MKGCEALGARRKNFFLYIITSGTHKERFSGIGIFRAPYVFVIFWLLLFLLYLPAARAGWVSDTLGWLQAIRCQSFFDFIARKGFGVPAYYQLTQAVTWCLYQAFGANRWAWHLLQLSLHALNATLLYTLLRGIFYDSRISRAEIPAFIAAALFCSSPYVSEVIVWEAAFHFLQGLFLILLQLHLLRRFLHKGRNDLALLALVLYAASLFSLEFFYLVPFFSAALCIYYSRALGWNKPAIRKAIRAIVLPQAAFLAIYFIALQILKGASTGRLGNSWTKLPITYYLVKPSEYLFHLFGGRFLPQAWRHAFYKMCSSYAGAGIFYLALAGAVLCILLRFRKMDVRGKLMSFLIVWLLLSLALVTPLWFPERMLIVGDRYLYVLLPAFFALPALASESYLKRPFPTRAIFFTVLLLQCALTLKLNRIWQRSAALTDRLAQSLSSAPGKITILLNNPASLRGAPMTGSGGGDGEARLMHNLFYSPQLSGTFYDAPAQNLLHQTDSIRIEWLDAQTIRVSLTRKGAFWQYGPDVARPFANKDFSVSIDDPDCCYTLRLAQPADHYRLLYQHIGAWETLQPK